MLKKRLTPLFLVLAMLSAMAAPAAAAEENVSEVDEAMSGPIAVGILTDDRGNEYEITGVPVENEYMMYGVTSQKETSVTYRFDVPALAAAGTSQTIDGPDSGYASHIWLKITYMEKNVENITTVYLLTGVSGNWTIEDPNVLVKSTNLVYGCSDVGTTQSSFPGHTVENGFDILTGYKKYVSAVGAIVGANLTLDYMMGARTWSFTMKNILVDNFVPPVKS